MHWAIPLYGYVMPVIVTLTLATNSFIVVVLSHRYLRTPTNFVLLAMAVSELLTGLCVMPWFLYYFTFSGFESDVKYGLSSFWCNAVPYMAAILPSVFHTTAIWLTVYLAIQRYIYICVPTLVRRFCTMSRSKEAIFAICIASVLMYIPDVFAFENESLEVIDFRKNGTRMCYRHQTWLPKAVGTDLFYNLTYCTQTIFVHLIPCAMLVVFTWKLIRAIQIADQRHSNLLFKSSRRKLSELPSSESLAPECNLSKLLKPRDSVSEPKRAQVLKQNTRMLLVVIVLFLVTEIPAALIFIIHVLSVSLKSYVINYQLLNVLLIVRNVLIVISYPFRFTIYCGMSQQFRDVVRQVRLSLLALIFRIYQDMPTIFENASDENLFARAQSCQPLIRIISSIPETPCSLVGLLEELKESSSCSVADTTTLSENCLSALFQIGPIIECFLKGEVFRLAIS
ncbi:unnamed protein product [Heligmosomoides polygyrus]|uniref:G_PROTEIN_RECEP_F1_2 domain-containing protein n=1 Tax=Heligmosomoides polygyrus TaxID=6339 RepID=A0A3P7TCT4_HELPZ|nr:unnamed protein product [Heligmosomoides polygyrus]